MWVSACITIGRLVMRVLRDWSVGQQRVQLLNITSVNIASGRCIVWFWVLFIVVCLLLKAPSPHNSVAAIVCVSLLKRGS